MGAVILIALVALAGIGLLYEQSQAKAKQSAPVVPQSDAGGQQDVTATGGNTGIFDNLIKATADAQGFDPVLLKAIVAKESFFNPDAINPEKNFVLGGVTYPQYDARGRLRLVEWIKAGNEPGTINLNPSMGLAQIRVGIAKALGYDVSATSLFDPATNLTVAGVLLTQLLNAGITLETIDAWNVGQALRIRNLGYRDAVKEYYAQFSGDFA